MWEAIETYMERKQPLIIVAGADYGQGSSRDWAAKGVRLAGVEAIVAEGFERIHRTNLIGMGVLPLEFKTGEDRHTYAIDGTETFDVLGEPSPQATLTLVINRKNGERVEVPVTCRLDTAEEVSIYARGGVLQRFRPGFSGISPPDRTRLSCPAPQIKDSRHLHARWHQQRRVFQPAGSCRSRHRCAGPGARCAVAARDRQP